MLNWYNTRALCTVLKALPNNFIFGAFSLDGQDLSLTFIVIFSRKVAKHWRYIVHLCHSEYEMQHTSRVYPRTKQPGTAMGVSTIHLSELSKLLLLFYTACPCLLLRYKATISFVMSVCPSGRPPAWNSAPNGRIFMKFDIWVFFHMSVRPHGTRLPMEEFFMKFDIWVFFFKNLSRKFKFR